VWLSFDSVAVFGNQQMYDCILKKKQRCYIPLISFGNLFRQFSLATLDANIIALTTS